MSRDKSFPTIWDTSYTFGCDYPPLELGMRGFLVFYAANRRLQCAQESLKLLEDCATRLYGRLAPKATDLSSMIGDGVRIAPHRFEVKSMSCPGACFINTSFWRPTVLCEQLIDKLKHSSVPCSVKHISRLVPIEAVCRPTLPEIASTAHNIFDKNDFFGPLELAVDYNIIYSSWTNEILTRQTVKDCLIHVVAQRCPQCQFEANALTCIIVLMFTGMVCMGVTRDVNSLAKFDPKSIAPRQTADCAYHLPTIDEDKILELPTKPSSADKLCQDSIQGKHASKKAM